ncbi:hypothetical protein SAMN02745857_02007 [Andreprevotia lacus DSM 23236]|uniref:DUF2065 domain-containing protein n=1 Tax=Andreprevotia lacus DSM 23236 TaxID=1121001 RepID=A0A1W1XLQ7_9NEIS|nr:DUF2065 domain-containing protein [Andreprevotia lacus]SMC24910.1 hypothetical protein SAMN02745857_02007 [Andreprevotia lacus DSM 23236]
MSDDSLWLACALVLVIEGLLPFAVPALWRRAMLRLARLTDRQIRLVGLAAMLCGLVLVLIIRY